ncbi:MAG: cell division control protein Cdc6, partial [Desulfurococcus sp.]
MRNLKYEPLSLRRISEIISQLDMMGLIISEVVNRGKYGITRIIKIRKDMLPVIKDALKDVEA